MLSVQAAGFIDENAGAWLTLLIEIADELHMASELT